MKTLSKAATSRGNKALAVAGVAVFATVSLQAANKTWDGGGANDNWNTQNNWDNNTNPAATDDVFLGSSFTSGTTIGLNGATRTVNSFTIGTTGGFTISNNQMTITSGNLTRTAASSGNQTFASIVSLTNAGTWNIAGSGTTTITGNIAGAGGYTRTGTGTLVIGGGAKTYTGNTTLNSGNVVLDYTTAGNKFGGGSGVITLGGATLTLTNGNTTENNDSTVVAAGHSIVNRAAGTSILQTDVITRNVGSTANFGTAGIATTDSTNTNGILGGWVTVSGTTWGFNASNGNNGAINGLATYETSNVQTNWAATENISLASTQPPMSRRGRSILCASPLPRR